MPIPSRAPTPVSDRVAVADTSSRRSSASTPNSAAREGNLEETRPAPSRKHKFVDQSPAALTTRIMPAKVEIASSSSSTIVEESADQSDGTADFSASGQSNDENQSDLDDGMDQNTGAAAGMAGDDAQPLDESQAEDSQSGQSPNEDSETNADFGVNEGDEPSGGWPAAPSETGSDASDTVDDGTSDSDGSYLGDNPVDSGGSTDEPSSGEGTDVAGGADDTGAAGETDAAVPADQPSDTDEAAEENNSSEAAGADESASDDEPKDDEHAGIDVTA
ncbi:MAG: hypothetical protein U0638_08385 [Phycisphaerales bacterium]